MERSAPLIPPLSLCLGAAVLAGAWLQPNHFLPWPSFHAEVWAAAVLLAAALVVLIRSRGPIEWPGLALLVLAVSVIPVAQAAGGLVLTSGQAMLAVAYLLGLGLAIVIGARWQRLDPGAGADGLFLAIGLASIGSVGFQLYQWLQLDGLPFLSMGSTGPRPSANVGQANLLGTLLLWGIVSGAWGMWRGRLHPIVFVFYAGFLLIGVALADSRAALLNAVILVAAVWLWRRVWPWRRAPWVATGLLLVLLAFVAAVPWLNAWFFQADVGDFRTVTSTANLRLRAYAMFLDAVAARPWLGHGWGQSVLAQMDVGLMHRPLDMIFSQAHNFVLDLLVWCGIPLAVGIVVGLAIWAFQVVSRVREPESLLLLMPLVVLAVHSMLELPFMYGFLVWPAGLFAGMLSARLGLKSPIWGRGSWLLLPCLALIVFTVIAALDYHEAEENHRSWRFEVARVGTLPPAQPPPMVVLNQLDSVLWALRFTEMPGQVSDRDVEEIRKAFIVVPGLIPAFYLAKALVLSGRLEEARQWQRSINHMFNDNGLRLIRAEWVRQSALRPEMARVPWETP